MGALTDILNWLSLGLLVVGLPLSAIVDATLGRRPTLTALIGLLLAVSVLLGPILSKDPDRVLFDTVFHTAVLLATGWIGWRHIRSDRQRKPSRNSHA